MFGSNTRATPTGALLLGLEWSGETAEWILLATWAMTFIDAKRGIARLGFPLTRAVVQNVPAPKLRMFVLDRVFSPYIGWRPFETITRTADGLRMHVRFPDKVQKYIYLFGVWEPVITRFVKARLRPGDLFVDVGANVGYYSLLAAKLVGPGGAVVAIEASPTIADLLDENIRINSLANVEVIRAAVADRHKAVHLFAGGAENMGQSTTIASTATAMGQRVEAVIDAHPLHGLVDIDRLRHARLIKVDIEGAEAELFDGMRDLLPSFGPDTEWIFELAPQALREQGRRVEDILEMFTASGYGVYLIENSYRMESYAKGAKGIMERLTRVPDRRQTLDIVATKRESAPRLHF